jgi:membrane protein DedA with SNARE-associated domain
MAWIDNIISHIFTLIGQGDPATLSILFLIVVLSEIGVPLPFIPDYALFLTGYQNGFSMQSLNVFLIVFVGRNCGAAIMYWLSYLLSHRLLCWIANHFPRLSRRITNLLSSLDKNAPFAIALLRLSGLLYLPTIVAGVVRLPFRYLILGVTMFSIMFDGATTLLGILTGHGFHLLGFAPTNWSITVVIIAMIIIAVLIRFLVSRRKKINNVHGQSAKCT